MGEGPEPAFQMELADEAATVALAARLAALARPGDVFALRGGLGAGKTVFARAFIQKLGDSPEEVPSPTFTLVQTYETGAGTIYHFDLYRIESPEETDELDLEDAFADGISLIEWPDRMGSRLPAERLEVSLAFAGADTARIVRLTGYGGWAERLTEAGFA
ncbi:MAG: tRNA (adenosine(37)-N6)-threonylcarbamoyltransferase complex ATPase subunit type 1 TsaE [Rhodospirillales bacterium]|nr:tRNA (adenosine(37)-N6)-threonylcarbamoyltransferase complex ATPase subunit type 1 TsaE [Rhodospirillales bacterium]